jgi:hypothetical protein
LRYPLLFWWPAVAVAAACLATAAPARADNPKCADLPQPVYGLGGSAYKPLIGKTAAALTKAGWPRTVVYQAPGACFGINGIIAGTKITGTASYWGADGKELTCDLPVAGSDPAFASMGNYATSCAGVTELPADVGDFPAPVQAFTLIVPAASSQQSISAEAAYLAFGLGAEGEAAPWTDEANLFRRDANSAAQLFIGLSIGVPVSKFKGQDTKSNSGTVTAVAASTTPEAALGLVSGEVADANRDKVRILAYQQTGQSCGYWPDSTSTTFDKRNVRTGQYYIWADGHWFAKIDGSGTIVDPGASEFIGLFNGSYTLDGVDPTRISIEAKSVPQCAMEVTRTADIGDIQSYAPPEPCGCFFDSVATGTTSCAPCKVDADCSASAPHCRHDYCEVN